MIAIRHLARLAAGLALLLAPASLHGAYLDASGLLVSQWRNAPFIDSFLDPAASSNATLAASVVCSRRGDEADNCSPRREEGGRTRRAPGIRLLTSAATAQVRGHIRWGLWLSAPEDFAAARLADLAAQTTDTVRLRVEASHAGLDCQLQFTVGGEGGNGRPDGPNFTLA